MDIITPLVIFALLFIVANGFVQPFIDRHRKRPWVLEVEYVAQPGVWNPVGHYALQSHSERYRAAQFEESLRNAAHVKSVQWRRES